MKNILTNPRSAAIFSFIICLPFALLFIMLMLNMEPDFGPFQILINSDPDHPNVIGSLIALFAALLVLAAFIINLLQIVRTMQVTGRIMTLPLNLILVVAAFAAIVMVIGAIIVDQYPCWMGVPNCD